MPYYELHRGHREAIILMGGAAVAPLSPFGTAHDWHILRSSAHRFVRHPYRLSIDVQKKGRQLNVVIVILMRCVSDATEMYDSNHYIHTPLFIQSRNYATLAHRSKFVFQTSWQTNCTDIFLLSTSHLQCMPSLLLAVPNVTTHPSTASVTTSYYSKWHYNCLCTLMINWF